MSTVPAAVAATIAATDKKDEPKKIELSYVNDENGKRHAVINGVVQDKEEFGLVKDWGPFFDQITGYWNEVHDKRLKEKDPYRQYKLNTQKDTLKVVRDEYRTFCNAIAGRMFKNHYEVALPYREYLEKKIIEVEEEARQQGLPDYFYPAFRGNIKMLKKVLAQFTGFTLAP